MMTQLDCTAMPVDNVARTGSGAVLEITGPCGGEQGPTIDDDASAFANEPRILRVSAGSPWIVVPLPGACEVSALSAERLAAALARLPKPDRPA